MTWLQIRERRTPRIHIFRVSKTFWAVVKYGTKEELIGLFFLCTWFHSDWFSLRLFPFIVSVSGWAFLVTLSLSGQRWAGSNHHLITLYCLLYIIITTTVLPFFFVSLYDSCILHPRRISIILSPQYTTILTLCFVFCQICFGVFIDTSSNSCYILDASWRQSVGSISTLAQSCMALDWDDPIFDLRMRKHEQHSSMTVKVSRILTDVRTPLQIHAMNLIVGHITWLNSL